MAWFALLLVFWKPLYYLFMGLKAVITKAPEGVASGYFHSIQVWCGSLWELVKYDRNAL